MPVKQTITYNEGVFFITFTCYKWLPLIGLTNSYDLVYKWFDYLKSKGHYCTGYVIMPNHVHTLIGFRRSDKSINKIIGDGKHFMAYEIIKRLEKANEMSLLLQLSAVVEAKDKVRGKKHEVWEDSFDWKECRNQFFIDQKLDYMHNNPCTGKWNLAQCPADYLHSSARFYVTGTKLHYAVTNVGELNDIDLVKKMSD
ncbi:MAG: hypothetical protein WKF70_02415 [Chitinophagaceae bacterium]